MLTIVVLIAVSVDNEVLAAWHVNFNKVKHVTISRICEQVVPCYTVNRLFSELPVIQTLFNYLGYKVKTIVFTHIFVFVDYPVGVRKFDSFEEIWKVFVDEQFLTRYCKA